MSTVSHRSKRTESTRTARVDDVDKIKKKDSGQHVSAIYALIVSHICLPAIRRFLSTYLSKSAESLLLYIPSIDYHETFVGEKVVDNNNPTKPVTLTVKSPAHFCWLLLLDPKMGLGEAYMAGDWSVDPNPTEFLRLLIRAKKQSKTERSPSDERRPPTLGQSIGQFLVGLVRSTAKVVNYLQHYIRENTLLQSTKNIQAHYDLGNDMFKLFLDKTMTYSCALFEDASKPVKDVDFNVLEAAQLRKIDSLLDQMKLGPDDHVLEIGCGWGSAAIRAVQRFGCKWTGITISTEQLELANKKVVEAGLEGRIDLRFQDYRMVQGTYTRVLSIEMIEAVGEKYLPQYFQIVNDCLTPNGIAAIQAILCPDAYYESYSKSSDFIKKYIFPGGHMPSMGAIKASLPKSLNLVHQKHMAMHYSATLEHWFFAWMRAEKEIATFGYPEDFHRRWQFYFCLCAALFSNDHIDVAQLTFVKTS